MTDQTRLLEILEIVSRARSGEWCAAKWMSAGSLPFAAVAGDTLIAKVYSQAYGDHQEALDTAAAIALLPELAAQARAMLAEINQLDAKHKAVEYALHECRRKLEKAEHDRDRYKTEIERLQAAISGLYDKDDLDAAVTGGQILSESRQQVGDMAVTFRTGRIVGDAQGGGE